tara:strand:- start:71 stop:247 length:177 start_codon:yes stop_codon:yes gene_type:complete
MTKTLTEAQKFARLYKVFRDLEKQTPKNGKSGGRSVSDQDKSQQKKNKGGSVKRSKKK